MLVFLISSSISAQTIGVGEVNFIEAKSEQIIGNKKKIEEYQLELIALEEALNKKVQTIKDEINTLIKERDDLIADMKVGAKCSQCGKYRYQFEKEGVSFQQHLGDVKGYAVVATTEELEAVRKSYAERIAFKKVQLQKAEKGDDSIATKRKRIKELEDENEKICKGITKSSQKYEEVVFAEAKSEHELWMGALMQYATDILIADDKITIFKTRLIRIHKESLIESEKANERLKKECEDKQTIRTIAIHENDNQISIIKNEKSVYLAELDLKFSEQNAKQFELESKMKQLGISDSIKQTLAVELKNVLAQLDILNKIRNSKLKETTDKIAVLEKENTRLKNEIFNLKRNLPLEQAKELARIKTIYDQQKSETLQSQKVAESALINAKSVYATKVDFYKKKNQTYLGTIEVESLRMYTASKKVDCSVWNQVKGMVMTNWNKVFPCVNTITTMAKPYSSHVFNSYCPGKSAPEYMSAYKSFLSGLSKDDFEAVKGNSNSDWFDLLIK